MPNTQVLKKTSLFSSLSEQDLAGLLATAEVREYRKGDLVFEEGSKGDEFIVVGEGTIEVAKKVAGGKRRVLKRMGTGDVIGELALFDEQPRSASAYAETDCRVAVFRKGRFFDYLRSHEAVAFPVLCSLLGELTRRLRQTNEKLNEGVLWGFQIQK